MVKNMSLRAVRFGVQARVSCHALLGYGHTETWPMVEIFVSHQTVWVSEPRRALAPTGMHPSPLKESDPSSGRVFPLSEQTLLRPGESPQKPWRAVWNNAKEPT